MQHGSRRADISSSMSGRESQYDMSRFFAGSSPSYLVDRDSLTLAVLAVRCILPGLNQAHIRLEIRRFRNVAILYGNLIGIDPALGVLVVADPRGADALRIDLASSHLF